MKKTKEDIEGFIDEEPYTMDDLKKLMTDEDYKDLVKCLEEDDSQFLMDEFDDEEQEND